ncbi:MAG: carboxypeptidase-like regulatory domain-containing protein, partial [Pyrinomonadaceae bacterium]
MFDRKTKYSPIKIIVKFIGITFSLLLVVMLTTTAHAQFRAAVQGVVTDSAGAIVADAAVTLTSNETSRTQTTTSGSDGFYRFSSLAPGSYTLTAEKAGFKKQVFDDVAVSAENVQGFDVTLTAGGVSEVVTVTTEQPALETEDANIRKTITTEEVLRLPQAGRDPYELARLAPGVFGAGARGSGGASSNLPNTSGPGGSNVGIFATENQVQI